jgi:biopolymer transport protein ExbD
MKFPRNAKIFRGQLDATPFAGVFFCLVIFLLLATLVYTPGVLIHIPESHIPASAPQLSGVEGPKLAVDLDANGVLYFGNQIIQADDLRRRLREEARKSTQPLTLILREDKGVTLDKQEWLIDLATAVGIKQVLLERLPRAFDTPARSSGGP